MSKLVTIYGGSGFLGRHIARQMAKEGWRVRVAVRRPNEALFVKQYGAPGQVDPVLCNLRDDRSVAAALQGADAVVNCAGSFSLRGKNNMTALAEGAGRIARFAAAAGVARLVHVSAIGADAQGPSLYAKAKAEGERQIQAHFPEAVILRPSVIFGPGDGFFNKFGALAAASPILPLVYAQNEIQPVYVDDVARAAVHAICHEAPAGIYELGGPEVVSLKAAVEAVLEVTLRRRLILDLPAALMALPAFGFDMLSVLSGGLFTNKMITRDQIKMLSVPNRVRAGAKGLADLGVTPTAFAGILPEYLWPYRPSGQYAAIKASAKNLKKV